jgi:hypothetical protein
MTYLAEQGESIEEGRNLDYYWRNEPNGRGLKLILPQRQGGVSWWESIRMVYCCSVVSKVGVNRRRLPRTSNSSLLSICT